MERIRVAAVNDYEIVIQGLAAMLAGFDASIEVADAITIGEPVDGPVDVALYDTYGRRDLGVGAVQQLVNQSGVRRVAIYSAPITEDLIDQARHAGATGVLSKSLSAAELVDALHRVARGEVVIRPGASSRSPLSNHPDRDWPGRGRGLTERESTVAVLLAQGLSNREIGEALYLSVNTVKTHVRRLLEKLEASNRTKATAILLQDPSFRRA